MEVSIIKRGSQFMELPLQQNLRLQMLTNVTNFP